MDQGTVSYFVGVVEDREDPLKIGRCRVRVVGLHTEDKSVLPTEDLPWAVPLMPITSASMSGVGNAPVGLVPGTWVMVIFRDPEQQLPIMLGTFNGIHRSQAAETAVGDTDNLVTDGGVITTPDGEPVKNPDGSDVVVGQDEYKNAFASFLSSLGLGGGLGGIISSILSGLFGGGSTTTAAPSGGGIRAEPLNANDTSKPTITPKIETDEEVKLTAQPETNKATDLTLKSAIPLEPGPEKLIPRNNRGEMRKGIKALLDACDKLGLTSKYAKCAVLGICGGETYWQPIKEGTLYTDHTNYTSTFKTAYSTDPVRGEKYFNWKGDPVEFFEFVYGFDNARGRSVGNKFPGDGGKYYGRGFVQVTGRGGYSSMEKALAKKGFKVPLTDNPDLLVNDYELSALVTVLYFTQRVTEVKQDSPNYFKAALAAVGKPVRDSYVKKEKMYEYFLGQGVIQDSTNKSSANDERVPDKAENQYLSPQRQATLSEDRPTVTTVGFQDPMGKYPLRNLMDEPSTNRLARGVFKDTALAAKDQARTRGIKYPNGADGIYWEQPLAPWGGDYPYAKVYESESGHLQMFDDTPGHETISLTHRTGTFIDVDANGTQVNKIVGDGYTIIDRNGFIHIGGACTINIAGDAQVSVSGSADIDVSGSCIANVHGNLSLGVASDVECVIGGGLMLSVAGDVNATIGGKFNLATSELAVKTPSLVSTVDLNVSMVGDPILPLFPLPEELAVAAQQFEVLQTPVRPSPTVYIPPELEAENARANADFIANPDRYRNPEAEAAGINPVRGPEPQVPETSSQISGAKATDLQAFLKKQLELANEGYWSERAMSNKTVANSNPNIIAMWKDLGIGSVATSDQIPWCAVFVNWTLKQCNYRYVSTPTAFAIHNNPEKWKATRVTGEVLPGDIIVWTYSHVSFVYDVKPDGSFNCVGGNQGGTDPKNNNPTGGLVTINYKGYTRANNPSIKAIYRPSKA